MERNTGGLVVIGSSNVDLVMRVPKIPAPGETVGDGHFEEFLGGKGANQACAAARLNPSSEPVTFVTCLGDDSFGERSKQAFASYGLRDEGVSIIAGEHTGTALIVVDEHAENAIAVAPGANAFCNAKHLRKNDDLLRRASCLLLQNETADDCLPAIAELLFPKTHIARYSDHAESGSAPRLVYNPAPAKKMELSLLSVVDTLIVNESEAAFLSGFDANDDNQQRSSQCAFFHEKGVHTVILTLGSRGLFYSIAQAKDFLQQELPAPKVSAVDTTGAGDTFCGTYASALAAGYERVQAIERAVVAASLSVTKAGAQSSVPTSGELADVLKGSKR